MVRYGISMQNKGGIRTAEAVALLQRERLPLQTVYRMLADRHGVSSRQIERSIRDCLLCAWERADADIKRTLVPWRSAIDPPSSREFLYALAALSRMEE